MEGFINFLKPPGMTSHDAVGFIRRLFQEKRVGHAGTLDPGAAGVLPIAVGRATRLIEYLDAVGKSYRAEMTFGFATDSGDDTGKVVERLDEFTMPDEAQIREYLEFVKQSDKSKFALQNAISAARETKRSIIADALGIKGKE